MLIGGNRGYFFLIFLSPRAKLLTPDLSSGENTCSCLAEHIAEHAISTFCWFLQFVLRVWSCAKVCTKNTWKSIATATKKTPKVELSFLTRSSKRLFVS